MKFFGAVLQGVREFRKLTHAQVGDQAGMSGSTVSSIEKGTMPQMQNFLRLCRWIGIKPSTFLDADIDMPMPEVCQQQAEVPMFGDGPLTEMTPEIRARGVPVHAEADFE